MFSACKTGWAKLNAVIASWGSGVHNSKTSLAAEANPSLGASSIYYIPALEGHCHTAVFESVSNAFVPCPIHLNRKSAPYSVNYYRHGGGGMNRDMTDTETERITC